MKRILLAIFAVVTTAMSLMAQPQNANPFSPKTPTPEEQVFIDLSKQKWDWMAEKNVEELRNLFHDQAQFVHMGGYWGKEQELGIIGFGGIWYKKTEVYTAEVRLTEHTATVYSTIRLTAELGGNEVVNPFIVSEVYVKEGDKWQLSLLAFTRTMGE